MTIIAGGTEPGPIFESEESIPRVEGFDPWHLRIQSYDGRTYDWQVRAYLFQLNPSYSGIGASPQECRDQATEAIG